MAEVRSGRSFPPPAKGYRPRCFFDVQINRVTVGRITFELLADICPKTCENFRALCTGEKGEGKTTLKPLHYKNAPLHRIVESFMVQGGDFSNGDGTGGESIYGGVFEDENFDLKHDRPFLLAMANRGPNTNGSQFFITLAPAPHLDNIHTVFGHAISGHEIIRDIENQKVNDNHKPYADVRISHCGELVKKSKVGGKKEDATKASRRHSSSDSSSSSTSEDERKKKKKKEKKKKKSKEEKPQKDLKVREKKPEPETNVDDDLNFIPSVPNSFLMRRSRTPSPIREKRIKEGNQSRFRTRPPVIANRVNMVSRSGKKMRGRGVMRYRTPTPESSDGEEEEENENENVEAPKTDDDTKNEESVNKQAPEKGHISTSVEPKRARSRSHSRHRSRSRDRRRSRSKSRERKRSGSRGKRRSKSPGRHRSRSRSRGYRRHRSGSRDRRHSGSRNRRRSRSHNRRRSRSKSHERRRSRSRDRRRARSRSVGRNFRRRSRSYDRYRKSPRRRSRSGERSHRRRSPRRSSKERTGKFDRHRSKSGSGSDSSVERKNRANKEKEDKRPTGSDSVSIKEKIDMLVQKRVAKQFAEQATVEHTESSSKEITAPTQTISQSTSSYDHMVTYNHLSDRQNPLTDSQEQCSNQDQSSTYKESSSYNQSDTIESRSSENQDQIMDEPMALDSPVNDGAEFISIDEIPLPDPDSAAPPPDENTQRQPSPPPLPSDGNPSIDEKPSTFPTGRSLTGRVDHGILGQMELYGDDYIATSIEEEHITDTLQTETKFTNNQSSNQSTHDEEQEKPQNVEDIYADLLIPGEVSVPKIIAAEQKPAQKDVNHNDKRRSKSPSGDKQNSDEEDRAVSEEKQRKKKKRKSDRLEDKFDNRKSKHRQKDRNTRRKKKRNRRDCEKSESSDVISNEEDYSKESGSEYSDSMIEADRDQSKKKKSKHTKRRKYSSSEEEEKKKKKKKHRKESDYSDDESEEEKHRRKTKRKRRSNELSDDVYSDDDIELKTKKRKKTKRKISV